MKKVFILAHDLARKNALEYVKTAPEGCSVTIAEPTRNLEQNAKFHALCGDIAKSKLVWQGKSRTESQVVTGTLTNINFTNRIVTIFYPPTKREMDCVYDDAVEDLLIENRRDLIQVTGLMVLDDAGAPRKITNVNDIRELDLSPLLVDTVKVGKLVLKAKQSISLEPATDETKQLICVTHAELGIDAFARTRDALVSELNEQIGMLWQEYALAEDDELDGMAIKMKQALLAVFSEVAHGA